MERWPLRFHWTQETHSCHYLLLALNRYIQSLSLVIHRWQQERSTRCSILSWLNPPTQSTHIPHEHNPKLQPRTPPEPHTVPTPNLINPAPPPLQSISKIFHRRTTKAQEHLSAHAMISTVTGTPATNAEPLLCSVIFPPTTTPFAQVWSTQVRQYYTQENGYKKDLLLDKIMTLSANMRIHLPTGEAYILAMASITVSTDCKHARWEKKIIPIEGP